MGTGTKTEYFDRDNEKQMTYRNIKLNKSVQCNVISSKNERDESYYKYLKPQYQCPYSPFISYGTTRENLFEHQDIICFIRMTWRVYV